LSAAGFPAARGPAGAQLMAQSATR
jgi:hypothetical protein